MVQLVQGDFMKLPFADNTFDGCFAIESTCHAPDRTGVYSEIFRVLKVEAWICPQPGFVLYLVVELFLF